MLTQVSIRDYAIIQRSELNLKNGMTALTGETGAGKSILLDALGLALGSRADANSVREGSNKAEICAHFDIPHDTEAMTWLQEHDLLDEETPSQCFLRRIIRRDGRSRAYINGCATPLQQLRELGALLINIHGQHEHQRLSNSDAQRAILDSFAQTTALASKVRQQAEQILNLKKNLSVHKANQQQLEERADMLRFQLQELDTLELENTSVDNLEQEHARYANAGRLIEQANKALSALNVEDAPNAYQLLSQAQQETQQMSEHDPHLSSIAELIETAVIHTEEAHSALNDYLQKLDINPTRMQWVEEQMDTLHRLARKHRITRTELPALAITIKNELEKIESSDASNEHIEEKIQVLTDRYLSDAQKLSALRQEAANQLSEEITQSMQTLSMVGGKFNADIKHTENPISIHGLDDIHFCVAANRGQTPRPLGEVASGGELARISLAIQISAARYQPVATLIFDEVDTGIGGGVAEVVGQYMRQLGQHTQVLSVTHLAQVAAQAHNHIQVTKTHHEKHTETTLNTLSDKQRTEELARMIGGVTITNKVRSHAKEMLKAVA